MIVDLARFVEKERPLWKELEKALDAVEMRSEYFADLKQTRKLLSLFQRACSEPGAHRCQANAEPELRAYLEALVARGYVEIHSTRAQTCISRFMVRCTGSCGCSP